MKTRDTASFFARLAETRSRALLLNIDVALKLPTKQGNPILSELRSYIPRLMKEVNTRLILITRNSARELRSKLNLPSSPEIWGNCGLEKLFPDGTYKLTPIDTRKSRALKAAHYVLADANLAKCLHENIGAVTLQWQNLSTPAIRHARNLAFQAWQPIAESNNLQLKECATGMELRLHECDPACAIRSMLAEPDPPEMIIYVGDDRIDENAFRTLRAQDFAVLLCMEQRDTIADARISSCEDLEHLFSTSVTACDSSENTEHSSNV
ncbi:MAG TPA: hypothetical protein VLK33_18700 [Terriglobales bacterium]|nr:hypothetical protein [Terriglobales bacterium]